MNNKAWLKKTAIWAVFWFAAGFAAFLAAPDFAPRVLDYVENLFRDIFEGREIAVDLPSMLMIFKNNFQAALIALFGGIFAGIIPLASLALNFFILGYLAAFTAASGNQGLAIFALTVMPHGIVEIPMLIIAAAFGLRLGFFWKIAAPVSNWEKIKSCLKDNLRLVPLLFAGLLLAAFLEIFVSGRLAETYLSF